MAQLIFVRHGESLATVQQTIGGARSCRGLSPLGVRQVEALATRWRNEQFRCDVLAASHFRRAIETAEILRPVVGAADVEVDRRFGELDPGAASDGVTYQDFFTRNSTSPDDWDKVGAFGRYFPDGETVVEMYLRVARAMSELAARVGDGTAVVCCHGGVIDAAMRVALQSPISGMFRLFTTNASITEVQWGAGSDGLWRLARYNDHAHLHGLTGGSP